MPGPQFFQTGIGRKFYEGDIPKIASALTRIADALEGGQAIGDGQQKVLDSDAKERGDSTEDVKRGILIGAELIGAFNDQIVPGVSLHQQREVLAAVANFVKTHSESYG